MLPHVTTLERAFQLARSGEFDNVQQIKSRLHGEGYSSSLIVGRYLVSQLREQMMLVHPSWPHAKPRVKLVAQSKNS